MTATASETPSYGPQEGAQRAGEPPRRREHAAGEHLDAGAQPGGVLAAAGRSEHGAEVAATPQLVDQRLDPAEHGDADAPGRRARPAGAAIADA